MSLKEKIAHLFGHGKKEKSTFIIFFKHSQRNVEFESTWEEVRHLSKHFGGEKGLKMDNFFVPWSEVASIYEKDPEEEAPKAGDNMPATLDASLHSLTPEAKKLGAETMEVIEDPKDAPADEAKAPVEEERI